MTTKERVGDGFMTAYEAWDREWQTTDGRARWEEPEAFVTRELARLRDAGVSTVLDHGCGPGRHALWFAREGFRVSAIDLAPHGLAYLARQAEAEELAIRIDTAPMDALPFDDGAFDYVLTWNVIHHGNIDDARRAVAEIRRVLRPGGFFQGTFLTKRNHRYGRGRSVAPDTYVIEEELEKSHPHAYRNAREMVTLLDGFDLIRLEEFEPKPGGHHWHFLAEKE